MGGQPSIYLAYACAALAHFFAIGGRAHAQETDQQGLIGGGFLPLSVTHTTTQIEYTPDESTTLVQSALGGEVLVVAGFGLGSWVLALEAAFSHSVTEQEQDEPSFEATESLVTKRSEITLGPSARFLFIEGAVRPFVEVGAGLGVLEVDAEINTDDGTTLYVRGGPGLQLRLTDAASLDLTLRLGYAATSGELGASVIGERLDPVTGIYRPSPRVSLEYDVQQILADVTARLSIWL